MDESEEETPLTKFLTNRYVATVVTLALGYVLCLGGYQNVWALFGAANQMLAALVLLGVAVFLKATKRENKMVLVPMGVMLAVTFTAIVLNVVSNVQAYMNGTAVFLVNGLQLILAVFLIVLAVVVVVTCMKTLLKPKEKNSTTVGTAEKQAA